MPRSARRSSSPSTPRLIGTVWAVASFRAGEISPDVTLTLSDMGWFMFLFPWQWGGGIWFVAVTLSILIDKSENPVYPHWVRYLSLWFCLLTFSDSLVAFFDDGAFAFNGLMAFYVPFSALLAWVIILTWATIRGIKRQSATEGTSFTLPSSTAAPAAEAP
jgi:hypothetical protein